MRLADEAQRLKDQINDLLELIDLRKSDFCEYPMRFHYFLKVFELNGLINRDCLIERYYQRADKLARRLIIILDKLWTQKRKLK